MKIKEMIIRHYSCKEKLIEEAIQHDNIHEACVVIQVALDIGDGAWAEWFFSGETPYLSREELNNIAGEQTPRWLGQGLHVTDIEKAYPKMCVEARRELFTRYYEAEEKRLGREIAEQKGKDREIAVYDTDGHEYIFETIEEYIDWLRKGTGSEERMRPLLSDEEHDAFEEMFMNNEIGWMSDSFYSHHHVHERGEVIRRAFVKIFGKDDLMTRWITLWAEAPYLIDWPDGDKLPAFAGGTFSKGGLKKMVEEGERPEERERIRKINDRLNKKKYRISWSKVYHCTGTDEVEAESETEARSIALDTMGNWEGSMQGGEGDRVDHIEEV